jgi:DNA polymerase III subunit delta'
VARLEAGGDPTPEADCAEGARHPRLAKEVYGQSAAIDAWLQAEASGRRHHAWMLVGPKGVGKATLAWKLAAHVLSDAGGLFGAPSVDDIARGADPDTPFGHRLAALSEPRLKLIRRAWDAKGERFKANISVEDIRDLKSFFQMSAADGGARVVIVDAADEMNTAAANALLKSLEEPPKGAVFFLIAETPSSLLPTIRSRCRLLTCANLSESDIARALEGQEVEIDEGIGALSQGSAGQAMRLARHDALKIWAALLALFESRELDRAAAHTLADSLAGKTAGERQDVVFDLLALFIARLSLAGAKGHVVEPAINCEAQLIARLSPSPAAGRAWADLAAETGAKIRHGRAVNLDPGLLLLDTLRRIEALARQM